MLKKKNVISHRSLPYYRRFFNCPFKGPPPPPRNNPICSDWSAVPGSVVIGREVPNTCQQSHFPESLGVNPALAWRWQPGGHASPRPQAKKSFSVARGKISPSTTLSEPPNDVTATVFCFFVPVAMVSVLLTDNYNDFSHAPVNTVTAYLVVSAWR